jgi:hypothetical protein
VELSGPMASRSSHSVIARDDKIDVAKRRGWIAESNHGNIDKSRFSDGLMIDNWVGHDDETWFFECSLNLIGE